jgi:hypothetical protein
MWENDMKSEQEIADVLAGLRMENEFDAIDTIEQLQDSLQLHAVLLSAARDELCWVYSKVVTGPAPHSKATPFGKAILRLRENK